ncbi:uncharacterized protein C8Q71DRAFT_72127 [Rhodofomes roseus]|uniref:Uncharacterized protein n=1 Tax=Rhodofomes roseus TaxID=34475 RepID=A0ABQ8KFD2_9APHY|nr:uncharacterized protein C8Q71DRAFT_72127 [Rhodofomes roseus]KAH9836213.1 hypothetical protein C8Q71DRAFT_72127 [Rhodofomes roseus]
MFFPQILAVVTCMLAVANQGFAAPIPEQDLTNQLTNGHWRFPGTGGHLQFGVPEPQDASRRTVTDYSDAYYLGFGVAGDSALESPPRRTP